MINLFHSSLFRYVIKSLIFILIINITGCASVPKHVGGLPVYGNWCGPGHPKNSSQDLPAIDELDKACKQHDLCYSEKGYLNCDCDMVFRDRLIRNFGSPSLNLKAETIRDWFNIQPCTGVKTLAKPLFLVKDIFGDLKDGGDWPGWLLLIPIRIAWTIVTIPFVIFSSKDYDKK